jgi:predicted O-methyltransferase YrrM
MTKIKKLFRAIGLILGKPYLLNKVLDDESLWRQKVKRLLQDQKLPEVKLAALSDHDEWSVKPFSFMEGGSLPTDLALLKTLASKFKSCRYFEIGTWRGESVANVAEVAAECVTLNLPDSAMREAGLTEEYINQHGMFSKGISNIVHVEADSAVFDFSGLVKKFDLIFIDGDHHFDSIRRDTENVFKHLVHDRSIVVWHDYAWQPGNVRYETLAAILEGVSAEKHNSLYAVRNTLCAIYYPQNIEAAEPSAVANKNEAFEVDIRFNENSH